MDVGAFKVDICKSHIGSNCTSDSDCDNSDDDDDDGDDAVDDDSGDDEDAKVDREAGDIFIERDIEDKEDMSCEC